MSGYEVRKFPSTVLRKTSETLRKINQKEKTLLEEMVQVMYQSQGIGLAAPQVGINLHLAVVDVGGGLIKLINPKIVKKQGSDTVEEGCLSVPGANVKVKRAQKITVEYMDQDGNTRSLEADGLLARAIQHEIDHLNGKLIIDYLNPIKRFFCTRRLKCH